MESFKQFSDNLGEIKQALKFDTLNELLNYTNISAPILQEILKETDCFDNLFKYNEILEHVIVHSVKLDRTPIIIQHIITISPCTTIELLIQKLNHDGTFEEVINRTSGLIFATAPLDAIKLVMSYYENYEPQDCDFVQIFKRQNLDNDNTSATEDILNYLLTITKDINSYQQLVNFACKTLSVTPSIFKKLADKDLRFDRYTYDYVTTQNDYKYGYPGTLVMKYRDPETAFEILEIILEQGIPDKTIRMLTYNEYIIYACKNATNDIINLILDFIERGDESFVNKVMNISYQDVIALTLIQNNKKATPYTIKRVNYLSKKLYNPDLILPKKPIMMIEREAKRKEKQEAKQGIKQEIKQEIITIKKNKCFIM